MPIQIVKENLLPRCLNFSWVNIMTNRQILKDSLLNKKIQQTLDDIGEHSEEYPWECKTVVPGNKYHSLKTITFETIQIYSCAKNCRNLSVANFWLLFWRCQYESWLGHQLHRLRFLLCPSVSPYSLRHGLSLK